MVIDVGYSKLDSIVLNSLRTLTCSSSVLALYIFINKKSESPIRTSKARTRPFLLDNFFLTVMSWLP